MVLTISAGIETVISQRRDFRTILYMCTHNYDRRGGHYKYNASLNYINTMQALITFNMSR